jgi:DNA polymerase III alpha subunit (gram-positive type)
MLSRCYDPEMIYVSLDCEASGPIPPLYNLLSIGATIVRPEDGRHVTGASIYLEVAPIFPGFDRRAMEVCGLDAERLRREGLPPKVALERLSSFVREQGAGTRERPCFVGHNAVFDWSYIAYYYAHFGLENPFGYKGLDTKSLAMGVLGIPWNDTSKENLERLLELPRQDPTKIHRADYDASYQALILIALLDRPRP